MMPNKEETFRFDQKRHKQSHLLAILAIHLVDPIMERAVPKCLLSDW